MASLKRVTHKNGRVVYRIVISLGYDKDGRKRTRSLTYSVDQSASPRQQEREALKYAMGLEDRIKYGHDPGAVNLSFEEFAHKWLEAAKESLAYGTYVGYEQLLRSRILPYFKAYEINLIGAADIEAFYKTLSGEYAPGTIRRCANVLNGIFGAAQRWNLIPENPCQYARKPKKLQETAKLKYFTPAQSLIFLKSLNMSYEVRYRKRSPKHRSGQPDEAFEAGTYSRVSTVPMQYRVFYALSIFCGFRKGETLALQWSDIDFKKREIFISKAVGKTEHGFDLKEPKNQVSIRKVPFSDSLLKLLTEYKEEYDRYRKELGSEWRGEDHLFIRRDGSRMGQCTTYQYFVSHLRRYNRWVEEHPELAAAEGIAPLPQIPLHGLRHSCATLLNYLDVNIIDISKYLGHASCSTTMNIYAHSFEEQKRIASEKLNDFISSSI